MHIHACSCCSLWTLDFEFMTVVSMHKHTALLIRTAHIVSGSSFSPSAIRKQCGSKPQHASHDIYAAQCMSLFLTLKYTINTLTPASISIHIFVN